jgi:hypothetical protein
MTPRPPQMRVTDPPEVLCEDCDWLHSSAVPDKPWTWLCLAWYQRGSYSGLSSSYQPNPPYRRCDELNKQRWCPLFQRRRDGQQDNGL